MQTKPISQAWVRYAVTAVLLGLLLVGLAFGLWMRHMANLLDEITRDPPSGELSGFVPSPPVVPLPPPALRTLPALDSRILGEWEEIEHWDHQFVFFQQERARKNRDWRTRLVQIDEHEIRFSDRDLHDRAVYPKFTLLVAGRDGKALPDGDSGHFWSTYGPNAGSSESTVRFEQERIITAFESTPPNAAYRLDGDELWICIYKTPPPDGQGNVPDAPTEGTEVYRLRSPVREPEGYTDRDLIHSQQFREIREYERTTQDTDVIYQFPLRPAPAVP